MQGLVLDATQKTAIVQSRPLPTLGPGEILIRFHSLALNPVDALYVTNALGSSGHIVGSDFAGVGVESRPESRILPEQRVAGFVQGACSVNDRPSAFAGCTVPPADLVWLIQMV